MTLAENNQEYDVVVGGGNAGLCAALSVHDFGGRVLLIEKAPEEDRGGNTKYAKFPRFTHGGVEDPVKLVPDMSDQERRNVQVEPYSDDMYYNDIMRMTQGRED